MRGRSDVSRWSPGLLLGMLLGTLFAFPLFPQRLPKVSEIDGDRVHTVLPPNAIPAIESPRFRSAEDARFMSDDEWVIGVVHKGVAKAYSLWHLDQHEIVNDEFGDDPVAVTW